MRQRGPLLVQLDGSSIWSTIVNGRTKTMTSLTQKFAVSVAAVALTFTLAGCGSSPPEDDAGGGSGAGAEIPEGPSPDPLPPVDSPPAAPAPAATGCPSAWPTDLGYNNLPAGWEDLYADIKVCGNGSDSVLVNKSDGVWAFAAPVSIEIVEQPMTAQFFRASVSFRLPYFTPGEVVRPSDWTTLSWAPATGLTVAWAAQEHSLDYVKSRGVAYLTTTLQRKSHHSAAVATCAVSAYEAATATNELDAAMAGIDLAQTQMQATSGAASCASAITQADLAAQKVAPAPLKVSWIDHTASFTSGAGKGITVAKTVNFLGQAARLCGPLPLC